MEIDKWNKDDWDAFVDVSPQGTVFHKSFFLQSYDQQQPATELVVVDRGYRRTKEFSACWGSPEAYADALQGAYVS